MSRTSTSSNTELDAIRAELAELRERVTAGDAQSKRAATEAEIEARRAELTALVQQWPDARLRVGRAILAHDAAKREADATTRALEELMPQKDIVMNAHQRAAHDRACAPHRARIAEAWQPVYAAEAELRAARAELARIESAAQRFGNPQIVLRGQDIEQIARDGTLSASAVERHARTLPTDYDAPRLSKGGMLSEGLVIHG